MVGKASGNKTSYFLFFDDLIMATYSKYLARQLDRTKWGCFLVSKESCRHIVIEFLRDTLKEIWGINPPTRIAHFLVKKLVIMCNLSETYIDKVLLLCRS